MDQDDPEKRIADLERRVAEQKRGADLPPVAPQGWLTPEQVRNKTFSNSPIGRGYNAADVDEFVERVEAALRDPTGLALTPEQVRMMAFSKPPLGKRGYNQDEVDQFRCRVEQQLQSRQGRFPLPPQTGFPPSSTGQLHTSHAAGPRSRIGAAEGGRLARAHGDRRVRSCGLYLVSGRYFLPAFWGRGDTRRGGSTGQIDDVGFVDDTDVHLLRDQGHFFFLAQGG